MPDAQSPKYYPGTITKEQTESIRSRDDPTPLEGYSLFVVQHVLDDLYSLLEAFIELGCDTDHLNVIGIPYSSIESVGERIRNGLKCRVQLPTMYPFDGVIYREFRRAYKKSLEAGKKLIVLEDGGYTAPFISQMQWMGDFGQEEAMDTIAGVVEQTSRGKWLAEQLQWSGNLVVPVVSIPDCFTKQNAEPPYIGLAVQVNLDKLLNEVRKNRKIETVGVYGFGAIGRATARHFRDQKKSKVYVADVDPKNAGRAASERFDTLDPDSLGKCDLVIGCTGSTSISLKELLVLKHDVILASASSRQVEVDMRALAGRAMPHSVGSHGSVRPSVMGIHAARNFDFVFPGESRRVNVLYDGYPVNFSGASLPRYVGDAVLSLLLEGVVAIATGRCQVPGVIHGGTLLEDQDLEIWELFLRLKINDGVTFNS